MAEAAGVYDQYTTIQPLFRGLPAWLTGQDSRRLASYTTYEEIYWNVPDAFKVVLRGDDANPIYIPSAKQIVETTHRFMANGFNVVSDAAFGSDIERQTADDWLESLFKRERFRSRWSGNKRYGIIRGDWLWHIYADPERSEGSRLSILPVDPASFFPLYNPENIDEIIGCHLVDPYVTDDGKQRIRRLTYRKETEQGGPSPIIMEELILELDAWGQPGTDMDEKIVEVTAEEMRLPDPIDSLPVYHIKNFVEPNNPFGSSEIRGLEVLITAINQAISDEDLTLAMDGLGLFTTTADPPRDLDTGEELPWRLGPGKVVEIEEGSEFNRIEGVGTVTPWQDHLKYLHEALDLSSGTPGIAKGDVDVQVAESGIALALRMGPLLARVDEKEQEVTDVTTNMLYDLRKWGQAYEGGFLRQPLEVVRWDPVYGDKIPPNRKQRFDEIMKMAKEKLVSMRWARSQLRALGYDMPEEDDDMMNEILEEAAALGQVEVDVVGSRIDNEIGE